MSKRVYTCCLAVCAHAHKCPWSLEKGAGSPGVVVTASCEPSDIGVKDPAQVPGQEANALNYWAIPPLIVNVLESLALTSTILRWVECWFLFVLLL